MSYLEHSFGESYSYAEMQSVYSAVPGDWASNVVADVMDCDILVSEFELQSHFYVTFGLIPRGKV